MHVTRGGGFCVNGEYTVTGVSTVVELLNNYLANPEDAELHLGSALAPDEDIRGTTKNDDGGLYSDDDPSHFVGSMCRADAEQLMASRGNVTGDYVVREWKENHVISVWSGVAHVHNKITQADSFTSAPLTTETGALDRCCIVNNRACPILFLVCV